MRRIAILLALLSPIPVAASACGFQFDPVGDIRYLRSQGWQLPGTADFDPSAPVKYLGLYPVRKVVGAKASALPHYEDPYIVEFSAQEFQVDGARKRMRPAVVRAAIIRWEMNGKTFAYSYGLVPLSAHRIKEKWVVDGEAGCSFDVTFIDDRGDGVFRVLVPTSMREDLVPDWVKHNQ